MAIVFLMFLFFLLTYLESQFPLRKMSENKKERFSKNIGYFFLNSILGRGLFVYLYLFFIDYRFYSWRELHQVYLPQIPSLLIALFLYLTYDFFIYVWHRMNHRFDFLFSFHKLHHADKNMDVSTGLRFHPGEYFFSYSYKVFIILVLGLEIKDVFLFDSLLLFFSFIQHSNLKIPFKIENLIGLVFITPRMHDIHHSDKTLEMDKYYGTSFVFWDKLFKTQFHFEEIPQTEIGLKNYPKTPSFLDGLFRLK